MTEKKVVAFIVEGPSEEAALGLVMKEYFSDEEVQFHVVHGDITTSDYSSADNIITKINELIDKVKQKYGYTKEDFLEIIHITDTDGVFCKEAVVYAKVDSVQYYTDRIETHNVDYIEKRNKKKSDILFKLYTTGSINGIRYRIFFNSCNLEHVLYNELREFSDEEKEIMADDFSETYEGKVEEFIKFISDKSFAVEGSYRDTWKYIEKGTNSLNRFTNMHLVFKED
ncbi:MAG: hypothetical protein IJ429_01075 [Lachnospiraceae bacterium]|nr:hypothetical protein [Lachnospiraceae bacterium]